jgi:hypothetical protein
LPSVRACFLGLHGLLGQTVEFVAYELRDSQSALMRTVWVLLDSQSALNY